MHQPTSLPIRSISSIFPAGAYTLLVNAGANFYGDPSYHLEIAGPVSIVGANSSSTSITAGSVDKVFSINSGAATSGSFLVFDVFISGITLKNSKKQ